MTDDMILDDLDAVALAVEAGTATLEEYHRLEAIADARGLSW